MFISFLRKPRSYTLSHKEDVCFSYPRKGVLACLTWRNSLSILHTSLKPIFARFHFRPDLHVEESAGDWSQLRNSLSKPPKYHTCTSVCSYLLYIQHGGTIKRHTKNHWSHPDILIDGFIAVQMTSSWAFFGQMRLFILSWNQSFGWISRIDVQICPSKTI
jgi:hypothetical protein